jgi:DNA invertase Pin-like site-specific DNA recombinase
MKQVRCAIYTRKSSDEGLEQSFNSLDAQREACAAYILSQASEGWTLVPDIYDDGGLSGGTLERPALQRLLGYIASGRVDIIVVYKVDRLTRSLLDFSRLVEAFDKAGVSFVSITQSFNTTTSMGRLTLNMLLSFAQFEREVTAERIRDKIAASKAKGMWMGGVPPIGYQPIGRSLTIVEPEAELVRMIYQRYLEVGNVRSLKEALDANGVMTPPRRTTTGKPIGAQPFSRGQLYKILSNRLYLGEITHKEHVYPGLHQPIVDRTLWDEVQALLGVKQPCGKRAAYSRSTNPLAGKVTDAAGAPLTLSHTTRGQVRYCYFVARETKPGEPVMRIAAGELETAIAARVAELCDDPLALVATAWLAVAPAELGVLAARCALLAAELRSRSRGPLRELVRTVAVGDRTLEISCDAQALADVLGVDREGQAPPALPLTAKVRLAKSGRVMRMVQSDGATITKQPLSSLIKPILQARRWWAELVSGNADVSAIASRERACAPPTSRGSCGWRSCHHAWSRQSSPATSALGWTGRCSPPPVRCPRAGPSRRGGAVSLMRTRLHTMELWL